MAENIRVLDMAKAVLLGQAFDIYRGYDSGEAHHRSSGSEYKLLNTFESIKAVSDTVSGP